MIFAINSHTPKGANFQAAATSRPVRSWIIPPGPITVMRHFGSFMSRLAAVRSTGADQVRPLSSLQRARTWLSSVPGRAVSVPRPGLQRRYKSHTRFVWRSTTVAGLADDHLSPACSITSMADQVRPWFVLRLQTRSISLFSMPGSPALYLRASAKANNVPSGATSKAGIRYQL